MLARIELGPAGYDLRTFECPKCNHSFKSLVANEPTESHAAGWLAGELKPPT
jgi:transcription elongation factor Elf1